MGALNLKQQARLKRKKRIRKRIQGTTEQPRLTVFRSAKHIYVQIIDDTQGRTITAASSLEETVKQAYDQLEAEARKGKLSMAVLVGKIAGQRAIEKGIKHIVFDRNGFLYHGRVKAVSEGARKAGLDF